MTATFQSTIKALMITGLFVILFMPSLNAQDMMIDEGPIAFRNTYNINTPTTSFLKRFSWEFQIRHRFGKIVWDNSLYEDFLGMDLTANIQFGFAMPIGNQTMIGVHRTKNNKTYGGYIKRAIMNQGGSKNRPLSIAFHTNVDVRTNKFKTVPANTYFEDGVTPFENKFAHKLIYHNQFLFSRKFGDLFSVQLSPGVVYRNLAPAGEENMVFSVPISGVLKTGMFSSFIFEYAYVNNYKSANNLFPLAIGYEWGTAGHVFQVTASTSPGLNEEAIYTSNQSDYDKGDFYLGFNLRRVFWQKKRMQKYMMKQSTQQ